MADWTLVVVASRYRWPFPPPRWNEPGPTGEVVTYPMVKLDSDSRTAWYGAVLV